MRDKNRNESISISKRWVSGFLKRHPELEYKKAKMLESSRASKTTPEIIGSYFDNLYQLFEKNQYFPSMVANFDETMVQFGMKRCKVIIPKDLKHPENIGYENSEHYTLGCTIFADGSALKPMVICSLKTWPKELEELADDFCWAGQQNGWINKEIFAEFCEKVLIPSFVERRKKLAEKKEIPEDQIRGLLIIDCHNSRENWYLMEIFSSNGIDVLSLPSHTTHVLQPLDCGFFRNFKNQMSTCKWDPEVITASEKRKKLLTHAKKAFYMASFQDDIKKTFMNTGIFPLNREIVLSSERVQPNTILNKEGTKKRKRGISIENKLLTSSEIIEDLKRKEKEEKEKEEIKKQKQQKKNKNCK